MKIKNLLFLILTVCLAFTVSCSDDAIALDPDIQGYADKLVIGKIITMVPNASTAEAITIKNGKVQYVGSLTEARKHCDDKTVVENYGKNSIYPGFLEGHLHGIEVAGRLDQCDLATLDVKPSTTMEDFVNAMAQYVNDNPKRSIYKGAGWSVRRDVLPTRQMLDTICPKVPMVLSSVDGHSMWLNTVALKKFKYDDPANIEKFGTDCIRLESGGFPTGYVSEGAMELARPALALTKDEYKKNLLKWQDMAFSYGITGVVEAAISIEDAPVQEAFMELAKEGKWKLRTYAMENINYTTDNEKFYGDLNKILDHTRQYKNEYFRVYGVKIFVDGVVEAHTAWLIDPYADDPTYYGKKNYPEPTRVADAVAFANRNGINVHFHAIGDAAVRNAVDGIISGQQQAGVSDARNTIVHLQIVRPEDVKRIYENHIIPVVAPLWVPYDSAYSQHEIDYLGQERFDNEYRIKDFFDLDCPVNFHSDYPVSPDIDMPLTIYCAVTRTDVQHGPEGVHGPRQAVTRRQALEAMTFNVAYQIKEENRLGMIKPGMVANLSIYDVDFLNAPIEEIPAAKVVATYVDGNVVYRGK
ncbi:MAG: amidohydrolase [Bacteroidales bacterium]|nr:amidohydrolase [Candidatus Equimonas faecalis]